MSSPRKKYIKQIKVSTSIIAVLAALWWVTERQHDNLVQAEQEAEYLVTWLAFFDGKDPYAFEEMAYKLANIRLPAIPPPLKPGEQRPLFKALPYGREGDFEVKASLFDSDADFSAQATFKWHAKVYGYIGNGPNIDLGPGYILDAFEGMPRPDKAPNYSFSTKYYISSGYNGRSLEEVLAASLKKKVPSVRRLVRRHALLWKEDPDSLYLLPARLRARLADDVVTLPVLNVNVERGYAQWFMAALAVVEATLLYVACTKLAKTQVGEDDEFFAMDEEVDDLGPLSRFTVSSVQLSYALFVEACFIVTGYMCCMVIEPLQSALGNRFGPGIDSISDGDGLGLLIFGRAFGAAIAVGILCLIPASGCVVVWDSWIAPLLDPIWDSVEQSRKRTLKAVRRRLRRRSQRRSSNPRRD